MTDSTTVKRTPERDLSRYRDLFRERMLGAPPSAAPVDTDGVGGQFTPAQRAAIEAARARLGGQGAGTSDFTPEQKAAIEAARNRVAGNQKQDKPAVPTAEEPETVMDQVVGFMTSAGDMIPFGEEMRAGAYAVPGLLDGTARQRFNEKMATDARRVEKYKRKHTAANVVAETAGLGASIVPVSALLQAAGMGGTAARSLGGALKEGAATGSVLGGLTAFDDGGQSLKERAAAMPIGMGGGALVGGAAGMLGHALSGRVKAPKAEQLYDAAGKQYKAMRATNADYKPSAVKTYADDVRVKLDDAGFNDVVAPKTHKMLDRLTGNVPNDAVVNIRNIHALRKSLGKIATMKTPDSAQDAAAAAIALRRLDKFIGAAADSGAVISGDARRAAAMLQTANANTAAAKRSDLIQGIERTVDRRAAAANSGRNIGNTIRQKVASALEHPRKTTGFTDQEIAVLDEINQGTRAMNTSRAIANKLGGGGGGGQLFATGVGAWTGGIIGGPLGASIGAIAAPGIGAVAKGTENTLTRAALRAADEMIRSRSPLFQEMLAAARLNGIPESQIPSYVYHALALNIMRSGAGAGTQ